MESKNFDFAWLLEVIKRNIKVFVVVGIVAAVVGIVISLPAFMEPLYKSTAVVYPVIEETYSDESETEQLLQIFEASSIRNHIIEKFNLYERYEIEEGKPASRFYIIEEYRDRVRVSKTNYESVRLEVIDEDPELAKEMADEILDQVNQKYNELINERGEQRAESYYNQLKYQRAVLDSLEQVISEISTENKVLEYGSQTRELVRGYVQALALNGRTEMKDELESMLESTQSKGSLVRMLQNLSYMGTTQYDYLYRSYLDQRELAFSELNYIDVIIEPEVADKKFWPVRWLILAFTVGMSLLVTMILIVVFKK